MGTPDPTTPTSPHLGGIQPTWRDLPLACELIQALYRADKPPSVIHNRFASKAGENKLDQLANFLTKVGLLFDNDRVAPTGVSLAELYVTPSQSTFSETLDPGVKGDLAPREQAFWKAILFERNWTPMLATVNLLATHPVTATETESRAEAFRNRVDHLDKYQNYSSINTWKKKAQAHFEWCVHVGLASHAAGRDQLTLTDAGTALHERLQLTYHPDWPMANRDA